MQTLQYWKLFVHLGKLRERERDYGSGIRKVHVYICSGVNQCVAFVLQLAGRLGVNNILPTYSSLF